MYRLTNAAPHRLYPPASARARWRSLRRLALPRTLPAGFNRAASCTGALLGRRSSNGAGWGSVAPCKTAHCCMLSRKEAAVLCTVDQHVKPSCGKGLSGPLQDSTILHALQERSCGALYCCSTRQAVMWLSAGCTYTKKAAREFTCMALSTASGVTETASGITETGG